VRDAAFGCDWVGTAIPFQRCLMFIIATANKASQLTAGKFVPVSNVTMMNVCIIYIYVYKHVCVSTYIYIYINKYLGGLELRYISVCVCVCLHIYFTLFLSNTINDVAY